MVVNTSLLCQKKKIELRIWIREVEFLGLRPGFALVRGATAEHGALYSPKELKEGLVLKLNKCSLNEPGEVAGDCL